MEEIEIVDHFWTSWAFNGSDGSSKNKLEKELQQLLNRNLSWWTRSGKKSLPENTDKEDEYISDPGNDWTYTYKQKS